MNVEGPDPIHISIILPAHNEVESLPAVMDRLLAIWGGREDVEVIVVNDHSTDCTAEVAQQYAQRFPHCQVIHRNSAQRGMGAALKEGTQAAQGDTILWVMADGSDQLEISSQIVHKLDEGYDLVTASRYMPGGSRGELDPLKAFLSAGYTVMARWLFGIPIHDITNAFRGFKKALFDQIPLAADDFAISPELAIKAHLHRYRLGEVPATYFQRRFGQTKFHVVWMMLCYVSLLRYRFIRTVRYNKDTQKSYTR